MRFLVTGGAGFIGSHVVDALIEQGHNVAVVDDLSTGFASNLNPRATFYRISICDKELAEVFDREKPQFVSHQAAQLVIQKSLSDPLYDASVNILGSLNLILNCVRLGVSKIIYASSGGACYGEPQYLPVDEKHPVKPISQYGVSKHTVEHYLHVYATNYGLKYTVLRYPNVYGPRQNPKAEAGVVAVFSRLMLQGQRCTIFGPGNKTRDYSYVSDVVDANILAIDHGHNQIYNIGTGVETSDQTIFDTLADVLGYKGTPIYDPLRSGEIQRIYLDCSKARQELGWGPRIGLPEGLKKSAQYYRELANMDSVR